MLRMNLIRRLVCALVVAIAFGVGHTALADPIGPGFDLFTTRPGTFHDLPGIGIVFFRGGGLVPGTNIDTIVERLQGIDPLPVGGMGTVPIVLRSLSLQSVAPVNIGGNFFDIFAAALPNQTQGSMTIFQTTAGEGTFISSLPVAVQLTFLPVAQGMPFSFTFSTTFIAGCVWSHTPSENYPTLPQFPAGDFFVRPCIEISQAAGGGAHVTEPAQTPEPATLLLLASGLTGIAGLARKAISRKK